MGGLICYVAAHLLESDDCVVINCYPVVVLNPDDCQVWTLVCLGILAVVLVIMNFLSFIL